MGGRSDGVPDGGGFGAQFLCARGRRWIIRGSRAPTHLRWRHAAPCRTSALRVDGQGDLTLWTTLTSQAIAKPLLTRLPEARIARCHGCVGAALHLTPDVLDARCRRQRAPRRSRSTRAAYQAKNPVQRSSM